MGKPMLTYAIQAALDSRLFSTVMVSTDDEEIAQIARRFHADVPFMRSSETANDSAGTRDVLLEVLSEYTKRGERYEEFCCIYPCVPLLTGDMLREAYVKFKASGAHCLMPVVRFSYPIQRALRVNAEGYLEYREAECQKLRSQDCEPMYHDVGMFYFYKTSRFLQAPHMCMEKCCMYELNDLVCQDIDTHEDWELAELKYKNLRCNVATQPS